MAREPSAKVVRLKGASAEELRVSIDKLITEITDDGGTVSGYWIIVFGHDAKGEKWTTHKWAVDHDVECVGHVLYRLHRMMISMDEERRQDG